MGYGERVDAFERFFDEVYADRLAATQSEGQSSLVVDFDELERVEPDLADHLIEAPEDALAAAEEALSNHRHVDTALNMRVANLPAHTEVRIRDLRSDHLDRMVTLNGMIKRASEVRPEVIAATFECEQCGATVEKEQDSTKLKSPYKCQEPDCGSRRFELQEKEMTDVQVVTLEEDPQKIEGTEQPRDIGVFLRDDLVDPDFQQNIVPGNQVVLHGVLKESPKKKDSKRYDLYVEGNHLDPVEREFEQLEITAEEEEEIHELGDRDDVFDRILSSIAPSIYGHERIKEAVALQLFGGVRKERPDGTTTRGDMHMLLIGEPGTGKSQILKFVGNLAPKGKYVVGKSATGAGITATVVKDELTEAWSLEAGALVMANKGIATIDEIDKMSSEDRSSLHEAMEQQTISVSKATIQATLQCRTAILAAGNPKYGRFDPYKPVPDQIDLGDTLLSRFDLIFPVKDVPQKEKDTKLANHIMSMHTDPDEHRGEVDAELLKKYIAYARRNIDPEWTEAAQTHVKDFYVDIREKGEAEGEEDHSVPMTARQLEALIRMSEAAARLKLKEHVEEEDAKQAIDLLTYCLKQIGVDPETGEFDIDRIESGVTASERGRLRGVRDVIDELQEGEEPVPVEDVIAAAEDHGIDEKAANEAIKRLKEEGDIYEPKRGFLKEL